MLKKVVTSLDSVDAQYHSLYTQGNDGKFYLQVEDDDATALKNALQAERLEKKQLQDQLKVYDNINLDEIQETKDKLRQIEEKKLLDEGQVEKVIEHRTENMKQSFEKQLKQLQETVTRLEGEKESYSSRLSEEVIQNRLMDAVTSVGSPRKEALTDIAQRGRSMWRLDEQGKPVAFDPDGTPIFGTDGKAPMTMQEWSLDLMEKAPHLFHESKGGGARGSSQYGNKTFTADQLADLSPAQRRTLARG